MKASAKSSIIDIRTRTRGSKKLTKAEKLIDEVSTEIFRTGLPYKVISQEVGVAPSTIANIATRKTRWPKPATLFPLLKYLGFSISISK